MLGRESWQHLSFQVLLCKLLCVWARRLDADATLSWAICNWLSRFGDGPFHLIREASLEWGLDCSLNKGIAGWICARLVQQGCYFLAQWIVLKPTAAAALSAACGEVRISVKEPCGVLRGKDPHNVQVCAVTSRQSILEGGSAPHTLPCCFLQAVRATWAMCCMAVFY
jgi:hypothetical protein